MKTNDVKALIGKPIKYTKLYGSYVFWNEAIVLDVKGKNVLVDECGMTDWLWLPDVRIVPLDTGLAERCNQPTKQEH